MCIPTQFLKWNVVKSVAIKIENLWSMFHQTQLPKIREIFINKQVEI